MVEVRSKAGRRLPMRTCEILQTRSAPGSLVLEMLSGGAVSAAEIADVLSISKQPAYSLIIGL